MITARRGVATVGRHRGAGALLVLSLLASSAGCGDGSSVFSATQTPTATSTAVAPQPAPTTSLAGSPSATFGPGSPAATGIGGPARPAARGGATPAPDWLGTRVLARTGVGRRTPASLANRRIITEDVLPAPSDGAFHARVRRVPAAVAARSTWHRDCPVRLGRLRYVTVSFWGFDRRAHTGELLLNVAVANDVIAVFRALFAARFPIEQMWVTSAAELDLPPTGDGNNTSAFVCRATRGSTSWSAHAYGLAIDVNPFQNPYSRGAVLLPELATAYLDRSDRRPGMIYASGPVVRAFRSVGWSWGGQFRSLKDRMHFSSTGR